MHHRRVPSIASDTSLPITGVLGKVLAAHGRLSQCTWNTASLLGSASVLERAKERTAKSLASRFDVLYLQETHGSHEVLGNFERDVRSHWFFGSFCTESGGGGVVIGIRKGYAGTSRDNNEIDMKPLQHEVCRWASSVSSCGSWPPAGVGVT